MHCKHLRLRHMLCSVVHSWPEKINGRFTVTASVNKRCTGSGFSIIPTYYTVLDCSSVIVVCDVQCSPAVWQNDRPQAAAAHSVRSHTHKHTLIYSLVICLSSNAVDQSLVGDDSMTVDLQRKLFGLTPSHLPEELIFK